MAMAADAEMTVVYGLLSFLYSFSAAVETTIAETIAAAADAAATKTFLRYNKFLRRFNYELL